MIPINKAFQAKEITFIKDKIGITGKLLEILLKSDFLSSDRNLFEWSQSQLNMLNGTKRIVFEKLITPDFSLTIVIFTHENLWQHQN
jgi:hypothetical protein